MGTFVHFKNIYAEAFDDCKPEIVVFVLKGYAVFCAAMLSMALYAFFYRAFTGFHF